MPKLPWLILILWLTSCQQSPKGEGIYYWKTDWELDSLDQRRIVETGMERVYLRLFDLDVDGPNIRDRGRLLLPADTSFAGDLTYVPVVFITNRVWRGYQGPEAVAEALIARVNYYLKKYPALAKSGELQIDCDWTALTRDAYFGMLRSVQKGLPLYDLSVTIRLHQYREREKNGVPPVKRGLLMCYNLAPANQRQTQDAIYDEALLKGYLKAPEYPLPLDVALPLFKWGAAFRGDKFIGLTDHPGGKGEPFRVEADTVMNGHFLRPGDLIRADGIEGAAELAAARKLVVDRTNPRYLLYYDWQKGALTLLGAE